MQLAQYAENAVYVPSSVLCCDWLVAGAWPRPDQWEESPAGGQDVSVNIITRRGRFTGTASSHNMI